MPKRKRENVNIMHLPDDVFFLVWKYLTFKQASILCCVSKRIYKTLREHVAYLKVLFPKQRVAELKSIVIEKRPSIGNEVKSVFYQNQILLHADNVEFIKIKDIRNPHNVQNIFESIRKKRILHLKLVDCAKECVIKHLLQGITKVQTEYLTWKEHGQPLSPTLLQKGSCIVKLANCLQRFTVINVQLGSTSLKNILEGAVEQSLLSLAFINCCLESWQMSENALQWKHLNSLVELSLVNNHIRGDGLSSVLELGGDLKILRITGARITFSEFDFTAFHAFCERHCNLQILDFSENYIDDAFLIKSSKSISRLTKLKSLALRDNYLDDECFPTFQTMKLQHLKCLDVQYNTLCRISFAKANLFPEVVNVSFNSMSMLSIRRMARCRNFDNIRHLILSGNDIKDESCPSLCTMIKERMHLHTMDLEYNKLTTKSFVELTKTLSLVKNRSVCLMLCDNPIFIETLESNDWKNYGNHFVCLF